MTILTKKCIYCLKDKARNNDNFSLQRRNRDGFMNVCKDCAREKEKERYKRVREDKIAQARSWAEKHPDKVKQYKEKYCSGRKISVKG